jgi:hypothetical protein
MPMILGYGEDSLSLHALSTGLPDILRQLGDPARSLVFFRPSFGRSGPGPEGPPSAQFGEFDAIIGTPRAIYLGEAKWRYMGVNHVPAEPQQLRHRVFRAYIEEHRRESSSNWKEFAGRMRPVLERIHRFLRPAPNGSVLARNLTYILRRLDEDNAARISLMF